MHVTFISQCKKHSKYRTQTVLDRYSVRTGARTWTTPITTEALMEVHRMLRKSASRHTAVSCFINKGFQKMVLHWTVGNRQAFGTQGEVPLATRQGTLSSQNPWISQAVALASIAGLTHDLGKMSYEFATKISPQRGKTSQSDHVRHELISALIVKNMLKPEGKWDQSWPQHVFDPGNILVKKNNGNRSPPLLFDTLDSAESALLFLIATHHHLFQNGCATRHVKNRTKTTAALRDATPIQRIAESAMHNFTTQFPTRSPNPALWQGIAFYARAALILADQKGSSQTETEENTDETIFFANTTKRNGVSSYNQTLKKHLSLIASEAKRIASGMCHSPITPLPPDTKKHLLQKSMDDGPFSWQNTAAQCLDACTPTLLLNIAATGAGKTRMNMRAAAVLSGTKPLAVTTALGLRTLTLQTGDSYQKDLQIRPQDISIILGCTTTRILHEYEYDDEQEDAQERDLTVNEELLIQAQSLDSEHVPSVPHYLQGFEKAEKNVLLLTSPILVSTIDYVVSAGDLTKKSTQGIALLRLMHSDLIIDEIDGFEPKSLAAILRAVKVSAMFGRNVIASSGTLPVVIADYIVQAYLEGHRIYAAMNQIPLKFSTVVIDDSIAPLTIQYNDQSCSFTEQYQNHLNLLQQALILQPITKKAILIPCSIKSIASIDGAISSTIPTLHKNHGWATTQHQKVSIGLVRISNIKNAIRVARNLSKQPNTFVVCYHSRHFMIQRFHIEKKLDDLLTRKNDYGIGKKNPWLLHFESIPEIKKILEQTQSDNIHIIVVATPVEEVGRDHDFDWAIIEPASAQSIVQTAGRVNRHRKKYITSPNIGILQFNYKSCQTSSHHQCVFTQPGYEDASSHSLLNQPVNTHHDVSTLIDFHKIGQRLDSSLRFDETSHLFSQFDSKTIRNTLKEHADFFIYNKGEDWMSSEKYIKACLRDHNPMDEFYIKTHTHSNPVFYIQNINSQGHAQWSCADTSWSWDFSDASPMLFGLSITEMEALIVRTRITPERGFSIQCYPIGKNKKNHMTNFGGTDITV